MKKTVGLAILLCLCFKLAWSQSLPSGNRVLPGIIKTAENPKTYVFEIKLKGNVSAEQARTLDSEMLAKRGIWSSSTDPMTHVCRVEVLKQVTEKNLRDMVSHSGLEVSKTFTE